MRRKCSFKGYAKFWIDPNSPLHCAGKSLIAFEPDCTAVKKEVAERKVCIDKTSNAKTRKKYCVYPIQGTTHCGVFAQPCPENPRICSFWDLYTRTLDNLICSPDVGLRNLINTQYHSTKGFFRKRSPSAVCNCPIFLFPNEIRKFQSFKT